MKVSVIGGGAWGTTLSQALSDNKHEVLIRDINPEFVEIITINLHFTHFRGSKPPLKNQEKKFRFLDSKLSSHSKM